MIKRTYHISGFDCPHCANKSETHLNKHPQVKEAVIDFNNDRLHISFENKELSIEEIKGVIKEVEDDPIEIKELKDKGHTSKFFDKEVLFLLGRILIAVTVIILSFTVLHDGQYFYINLGLYAFALLVIAYDVYFEVIKHIIHFSDIIDEELLMTVTSLGAFVLASITKEVHIYFESLMVMILFQIGEIIEGYASKKSKEAISKAVSLKVETANLYVEGDIKQVSPESLNIGDIVVVSVGEQIPIDGEIVDGKGELDTSSLTGEYLPIESSKGLEVYAGYIVKSGSIKVKVNKTYENSAISKVIELIASSGAKKRSKADEFVDKFAKIYTPIIIAISILVAVIGGAITIDWSEWVLLGLKMLVVGCPCAIVISVPLAYFSAIGLASKNGIVIKGTNYLDQLVGLKKVVTDKTGTLTKGSFEISKVEPINASEEELLENLIAAEYLSTHPIALAILKHKEIKNITSLTSDYNEYSGLGVSIIFKGKKVLAGNAKLLKKQNIKFEESNEHGVVIYVAREDQYLGYVVLNDEVKKEAKEFVSLMQNSGVEVMMLTGDKEENARVLAENLGIKRYKSGLLPDEKTKYLEHELSSKYKTAFVGDGINDAASIKEADIGFAMGAIGSDVAIENADVVIMKDDITKVYDSYKIAKIARRVSIFNILFAIFIKMSVEVAAIVTNLLGKPDVIPMWLAVLTDTGLLVVLVINSLLILYRKIKHKRV